MLCIDISTVNDIRDLSEFIIRANNSFDINEVLKKGNGDSATVITPSQIVNAEFQYGVINGGHATVINSILKTIFPGQETIPNLYYSTKALFIIVDSDFVEIAIDGKINKYQYDKIIEFLNKINVSNIRLFLNDDQYTKDELIKKLDELIEEKEMPLEYPIGEVLFDKSFDEADKDNLIDEYLDTYFSKEKSL